MSRFLLDVNVLIALIEPAHVQHDLAHDWFAASGRAAGAMCPLTENGVLRIVGNPRYPNSPATPAAVAPLLAGLCALPGHQFWADNISLRDATKVESARLLTAGPLTDTYLLALAVAHGAHLATLDRRLVADAVQGGRDALCLIG